MMSSFVFRMTLRSILGHWPVAMRTAQKMHGELYDSVCKVKMTANAPMDTGAILAPLDRTDRWHGTCVDAFRQMRLPLLTSEAVLTVLFHLVGNNRHEMDTAWKFVRSGAIVLAAIEHSELPEMQALMARY